MKQATLLLSIILAIGLIFLGCSSSDDSSVSNDSGSGTETSFNFTLASLKKQETASSAVGLQANFTADQVMTGQLTATNTDTSVAQTFDWSIYFDEDSFGVQSNKTIILAPGTYDFALLLTKGDQQYAGSVAGQAIADGTFDVPMTIRPIIGNTITDVTLVASLAEFKFQYDPAELAAASLANPQMGIIIGTDPEVIYSINPTTGISDIWINLNEGSNSIQLKLYNGSLQVGRSITAQESVIVTAGLNITMDLVALHGETTFALTEAGGDAHFTFSIPSDVVDEAGGLGNLQVLFSLIGSDNPLEENILALTPDGTGGGAASITLSNKQFDEVTLSLAFTDISESELLGSCSTQATLDTTERTLNCGITLRRRAIIGGSLLATLGINVFNEAGEPVAGAVVSENGNILGITGSGSFGTSGYLKIYLMAGNYTIKAETDDKGGEASVSLGHLTTNNASISLTYLPGLSGIWNFRDGGGDLGLNKDPSLSAAVPRLTAFNSKLYAMWHEDNSSGISQVRIAEWDGNSTWIFKDGGGPNGINKDTTKDAEYSQLTAYNSKLYAIWREQSSSGFYQIRVAEWDGNSTWIFKDGDGANGINKNVGRDGHVPELTVFNSKLYATWTELNSSDIYQVRVAEWDGNATWVFKDGDGENGINKNPLNHGVLPQLSVFNSKLYSVWRESNVSGYNQIRIAEWDGTSTWSFVDGNGDTGINYNTDRSASHPRLAAYSGKLYATWHEENSSYTYQIRMAEWDGSSSWVFKDGNTDNGINKNPGYGAYGSQLTVLNSRLYAIWVEQNSTNIYQTRVAEWDGNLSWIFKDGDGVNGINQNVGHAAVSTQLTYYNSTLYAIWREPNNSGVNQIRVAEGGLE